jgi:hypothetical protein
MLKVLLDKMIAPSAMVVAVALISVAEATMSVAVYRLRLDVGWSRHVSGGYSVSVSSLLCSSLSAASGVT